NYGYHDSAISLALVNNAILRALSPGTSLKFINHPLPYSLENWISVMATGSSMAFQFSFNLGFCLGFVSSFLVLFPAVLWITAWLWDWLWMLLISLLIIATLACFQETTLSTPHELAVLWITAWLWDWLWMLLISVLIIATLACFQETTLSTPHELVLRFPQIGSPYYARLFDYIFSFLPTYNVCRSLRDMSVTSFSMMACDGICDQLNLPNCTRHTSVRIRSCSGRRRESVATYEDSDVSSERARVCGMSRPELARSSLVCRDLCKFYGSLLAVNRLSFGYCPQFDALFDTLTARETLHIFSLLRGIPARVGAASALHLANSLGFTQHFDKKRKISTAVALLGDSSLLYLDEPTTGMDPASKRLVWSSISAAARSGRSVVLTSHSMEECEALCSRLTVMVSGRLHCLGPLQHLKTKFSQGFTLIVKCEFGPDREADLAKIDKYIQDNIIEAKLIESYLGISTYYLNDAELPWWRVFHVMEAARDLFPIEDYAVSQTTLEQVFLRFTRIHAHQD
ncbi:ATP-binding cassette sub-family A member 3, partial [Operophtera brumata]